MIELRSVTKRYPGGNLAVDSIDLEIASGELCVLVGPSGCGKTTTLKMINRLIEPDSGEILIDGENILSSDPVQLRRRIGFVMQQGGLFPHLRVADNVASVPRLLGWPKERVRDRVEELLELVGLEPSTYLRRYPHELSGGERQRVGVARALGGDPPVLLMDEPFGAVDPIARKRLQSEFSQLQARLQKTVVFVTHDIEEALLLGSHIAIMAAGGVLAQFDTPEAILTRPASPFVAEFVGADRDLLRLGVILLERGDLELAPSLPAEATIEAARVLLGGSSGSRLVLLDADDRPTGWVDAAALERTPALARSARPLATSLPLGTPLKVVLTAMLRDPGEVIAISDASGYVGILTPELLHAAMRRSATDTSER